MMLVSKVLGEVNEQRNKVVM